MRPVFYEIERSVTSKFSIIMIVAIIGLSALISYEVGATSISSVSSAKVSDISGYYINGDNLTVVTFLYNEHGDPSTGTVPTVVMNGTNYTGVNKSPGIYEFNISMKQPLTTLYVNYSVRAFGFRSTESSSVLTVNPRSPYSGYDVVGGLQNPKNSSSLGALIFYVGPNGNTSPPATIYLSHYSLGAPPTSIIENNIAEYNYSGFTYVALFPSLNASSLEKINAVMIVQNNVSSEPYIVGTMSVYTPLTTSSIASDIFSSVGTILTLFIPLLAIFMGYLTYGKDRTTGVLESVIKRPITKGGLIRSRFLANSVVIVSSIIVAVAVSDVIFHKYNNVYVPTSLFLYIAWAYSIIGVSFLALSYLFSHILKSQGALLGLLIAVFIIFDLFWSVLFDVAASALSLSPTSAAYVSSSVMFDYASPAGYASLVQLFFTQKVGSIFSSGQSINPAAFGVTPLYIVIAGILWVAVPFAIAHTLAVKRD
jgi:ABC-2 type transport system permease protein